MPSTNYYEDALRAEAYKPLAKGDEPYRCVNETRIAPWVIYVLARQAAVE